MINWFQHDADGNIVRTGYAGSIDEIDVIPELTTRIGAVNPLTDYWDGTAVATYDAATQARKRNHPGVPGYIWRNGDWVDHRNSQQKSDEDDLKARRDIAKAEAKQQRALREAILYGEASALQQIDDEIKELRKKVKP